MPAGCTALPMTAALNCLWRRFCLRPPEDWTAAALQMAASQPTWARRMPVCQKCWTCRRWLLSESKSTAMVPTRLNLIKCFWNGVMTICAVSIHVHPQVL